jgi:serine protease Do
VKLGRLEDGEKPVPAVARGAAPEDKSSVKKALGLELSDLTDSLRQRYKIKDTIKGVVITGVDRGSVASEQRLAPGEVILQIAQEQVVNAAEVQKRIEQLKKDGRKSALIQVFSPTDGDTRFVALSLQ